MNAEVIPLRRASNDVPEVSDSALMAACITEDRNALGQLYDRHHEIVWRFLARLLGDGCPELDDLVQSTFVELWRGAKRFKGDSTARTWILGIANNLARRHIRDNRRRKVAMTGLAEVMPSADLPEAAWLDRLQMRKLQAALLELKPDLRSAFVLCDIEEFKGVEAAKILGIRPGTLGRRLHDARKALRAGLEGGGS